MSKNVLRTIAISTCIFVVSIEAIVFLLVANPSKDDLTITTLPISTESKINFSFYYKPIEDLSKNETLLFKTYNQFVEVFVEDELIYSLSPENTPDANTTGNFWNIIPISKEYASKQIVVTLSEMQNFSTQTISFYQGDINDAISFIFHKNFQEILISIFFFFAAITICVYTIFKKDNSIKRRTLLQLTGLCLIISIIEFSRVDLITLFLSTGLVWNNLRLVMFNLVPLTICFCVKNLLEQEDSILWTGLISFNTTILIGLLVAEISGIKSLNDTQLVTNVTLLISLICTCIKIIQWFFEKYNIIKTKTKRITPQKLAKT